MKSMKCSLVLILATICLVSPLIVTAQTPVLVRTFNNPTPATGDNFGTWMATLDSQRILVSAPYDDTTANNAGIVYLFHTNGTLLTTFTNPSPANFFFDADLFGNAVATLGNDSVLVGSPNDRAVYQFATNGALVNIIESVNYPEDISFGAAVVGFGNDRVLIGAPDYTENPDFDDYMGAAYLYHTNGALLATFSNPDPHMGDGVGFSLAAFGSDRVLVGSRSIGPGTAYLFNTNGTLLMTFTNPSPATFDYFGQSVAAVGTDRVLVGAYGDDTATTNAGAVYLFNTNGALLLTITNPAPTADDNFGNRMAMLGGDRVVIGAPGDDTTGPDAGSAYVFNVNGTLLATLNNPAPAANDRFGSRIAPFGSEGVIIGAALDDAGAVDAGSAYLFIIPSEPVAPSLTIQQIAPNQVTVSWPSPSTGYILQTTTNQSLSGWTTASEPVNDNGTIKSVIISPMPGNRFYRLFKP